MPRLYAIADRQALEGRDLPAAVEAMAEAGVGWIQVRAKETEAQRLRGWVEDSSRRLEGSKAKLWVNDSVAVAASCGVDGLHLGQGDASSEAARGTIGARRWLGRSTHDLRQVACADADPEVDVIAIGPIFETRSKACPSPVVGLEGLRAARQLTAKPLVAIGGIEPSNIADVLQAGADSAAVLGAVCRGDVREGCRLLLRVIEERV